VSESVLPAPKITMELGLSSKPSTTALLVASLFADYVYSGANLREGLAKFGDWTCGRIGRVGIDTRDDPLY
jgi:hypothetical protein